MQTAGDYFNANVCFPYDFFKVVIVHKLLAIIIRFFVGFIKIPASLKISALRNYISFFCVVYNYSGLLTIEFLLKEKVLSGDKAFGYTLRFADICDSTDIIL